MGDAEADRVGLDEVLIERDNESVTEAVEVKDGLALAV